MAFSRTNPSVSATPAGPVPHPAKLPQLEVLDIKTWYRSQRRGGDFFDGVVTGSRLLFLLTDIAGRRAETDRIAVEVQSVFRTKALELFGLLGANESDGIAQLAGHVNRAIIEAAGGVRFAPAFVGCYNLGLGLLTYHNASLLAVFRDSEGVRILETGGIPMGLFTHCTYEPAFLAFEPKARLLLVTKGVSERRRGGKKFGGDPIRQFLESINSDSASEICEAVLEEAYVFGNSPGARLYDLFQPGRQRAGDDLTAVVLARPSDGMAIHPSATSSAIPCEDSPDAIHQA